jgi:hypothetical protein
MLAFPAAAWVALSALLLVISRNWRWSVAALALQYVGIFALTALSWPLPMAAVKLVSGWMAGAILGVAMIEAPQSALAELQAEGRFWPSGRTFRLLAAALGGMLVVSLVPQVSGWLPGVRPAQAGGGLMLLVMGLLHLGLTAQPLRVVLGLLTVLGGFEVLYATVESSALVAGLLAGVHLGLAMVGAYLINAPEAEANA